MPTFGGEVLSLADIQKQLDPKGAPAYVVNKLSQSLPIASDAAWKASNQITSHTTSIMVGEPTVSLRRINEGTAPSKSTYSQVVDGMSLFDAWSFVDAKALELSGHPEAMRMNAAKGQIQSIGKLFEETFWTGDEADDDREFFGVYSRYTTLGDNVLSCGGTGSDQSSVWLINWSDDVHLIYPEHCMSGVQHYDHSKRPWAVTGSGFGDTTNIVQTTITAYVDQWTWDAGLVVADDRQIVRIANLEHDGMVALNEGQALTDSTNLLFNMARAVQRLPNQGQDGRPAFYMPRSVYEEFTVQALRRTTDNVFKTEDVDGKMMTTFYGIPLRISDRLGYTEAQVS